MAVANIDIHRNRDSVCFETNLSVEKDMVKEVSSLKKESIDVEDLMDIMVFIQEVTQEIVNYILSKV